MLIIQEILCGYHAGIYGGYHTRNNGVYHTGVYGAYHTGICSGYPARNIAVTISYGIYSVYLGRDTV